MSGRGGGVVDDGRLSRRTLRPSRTREGRPIIGIKIILNCCQNSSKDKCNWFDKEAISSYLPNTCTQTH